MHNPLHQAKNPTHNQLIHHTSPSYCHTLLINKHIQHPMHNSQHAIQSQQTISSSIHQSFHDWCPTTKHTNIIATAFLKWQKIWKEIATGQVHEPAPPAAPALPSSSINSSSHSLFRRGWLLWGGLEQPHHHPSIHPSIIHHTLLPPVGGGGGGGCGCQTHQPMSTFFLYT